MVGPIPTGSTLAVEKADRSVATGYIELSGTSFAAPVISGIAAQVACAQPELDAGSGQERADAAGRAGAAGRGRAPCGVGQVNAVQSVLATTDTPNPNQASTGSCRQDRRDEVFNAVSWTDVSWSDVSWDAVSWSDVSWSDVSWDAVSWSDVSWTDVSWSDVSWSDVSWEDNADGETTSTATATS